MFIKKFATFLSAAAGAAVLLGYFLPNLNTSYYLVPVGGALAIISALLLWSQPY